MMSFIDILMKKMDYFVSVPELSYLYVLFYKKEIAHDINDELYLSGATEIYEKCRSTLESLNIFI